MEYVYIVCFVLGVFYGLQQIKATREGRRPAAKQIKNFLDI